MERSAFQLLLDNIQSHHCHVPANMSFRSIFAHMGSTNSRTPTLRTQVASVLVVDETDPRAEVLVLLRLRR